jgi:quercetin dioxygenase-like cupin family protein
MEYVKKIGDYEGVNQVKFYKTTLFRGDTLLLGLNCLEPGQVQHAHTHDDQDKFYYVAAGHGRFQLGETQVEAAAGELVWCPAGLAHGVENVGNGRLTLLVGIAPAP